MGTGLCIVSGLRRVEPQDVRLAVGSGAAGEVSEGQLAVLRHRGEAEVLTAEEEQRVEEDEGGGCPQLLALPQKLLLHPGGGAACGGRGGTAAGTKMEEQRWRNTTYGGRTGKVGNISGFW